MNYLKKDNKFAKVNGINIRYWQQGDKGSTVILLHGLGGFLENWHKNFDTLSQHHRVFALDLPGFGQSDKPNCKYDIDFFLETLVAFVEHFQLEKVTFIGNSLGGGLSLMMAIRYPEQVHKIILTCPVGFSKQLPISFKLMSISYINQLFLRPTIEKSRAGIKSATRQHHFITDEYVETFYNYIKMPATKRALLNVLSSMANVFGIKSHLLNEVSESLPNVNHKALIIWGEEDPLLPLNYAKSQIIKMPNAKLVTLNNCGHVPQLEMPDTFNELVIKFI